MSSFTNFRVYPFLVAIQKNLDVNEFSLKRVLFEIYLCFQLYQYCVCMYLSTFPLRHLHANINVYGNNQSLSLKEATCGRGNLKGNLGGKKLKRSEASTL